jgi:hypothetical protein
MTKIAIYPMPSYLVYKEFHSKHFTRLYMQLGRSLIRDTEAHSRRSGNTAITERLLSSSFSAVWILDPDAQTALGPLREAPGADAVS